MTSKTERVIKNYEGLDNPITAAMDDCRMLLKRWKKHGRARDLADYERTAEAVHIMSTRLNRTSANRVSAMKRLQQAGLLGPI